MLPPDCQKITRKIISVGEIIKYQSPIFSGIKESVTNENDSGLPATPYIPDTLMETKYAARPAPGIFGHK